MPKDFSSFLIASRQLGQQPDLVQGGGGNTSFKLNEQQMAIKASGYQLKELSENDGYTVVGYPPIITYFEQTKLSGAADKTQEEAGGAFIRQQVDQSGQYPNLRPSMETGFHAVLDRVVYHTHSVYSNLINCATTGESLLQEALKGTDWRVAWIPYCNPGFTLSYRILQVRKAYQQAQRKTPDAYFLQNHGLVTTGQKVEATLVLDQAINQHLRTFFSCQEAYPQPQMEQEAENRFRSTNPTLSQWIREASLEEGYFERILFPDQVVFFSGNIYLGPKTDQNKININPDSGQVFYQTGAKEARTIEETLLAYLFIERNLERLGYQPHYIAGQDADYINNMESEAYRRSLLK